MKFLMIGTLSAVMLSGCVPLTTDEQGRLAQVMYGISGAAQQQQADYEADFYRQQALGYQAQQATALQQMSLELQEQNARQQLAPILHPPVQQRGAQSWY